MSRTSILKILVPVALAVVIVLTGCSGKGAGQATTPGVTTPGTTLTNPASSAGVSSTDSTRYKPTWVEPAFSGEQAAISLSIIEASKMAHFRVTLPSGNEAFMAYKLDGITYIRADICPPCRSTSFSLQKGVLVCDTCGTKFEAKTGKGISGACVRYPKSEVKYELREGNLTTNLTELAVAYAETLKVD